METRNVVTPSDLETVFPVIQELRPKLTFPQFLRTYEEANRRDQYEIIAVFDKTACLAAMGYRVLFDLVHGKHLYVDDLVVTHSARSKKIGAKLLKLAEAKAMELKCEGLRLCTGIQNEAAKRFYEREGWQLRSFAFKKSL